MEDKLQGRRKVSAEEGRRMYDAFRFLDKDNSNKLTYAEFEEAMVALSSHSSLRLTISSTFVLSQPTMSSTLAAHPLNPSFLASSSQ